MGEWISIDDRLPYMESDSFETFGMIEVITWDGRYVEAAEFSAGRTGEFWTEWHREGVTHWMPLPEPPQ